MSAVPRPRRRLLARTTGVASLAAAGLLVVAAGFAPTALHAGDDDWSLERKASDPALVSQRFAKLRRNPFDQPQWRALRKALGPEPLARRITAALERTPDDVALRILSARTALDGGDPARAAKILAQVEPKAGRWREPVFAMRIDALVDAGDHEAAMESLLAGAERSTPAVRIKLLERAYTLADRAGLEDDALRLARRLADHDQGFEAQLRLARAASRANDARRSDEAYADALDKAPARRRDDLVAERARARLDADNPAGASELVWSLLEPARNGTRAARAQWWSLLVEAHQRDATVDVLIARLRTWLQRNDDEAAAWRTLAQAQEIAGLDPVRAWRKTTDLGPHDTESRTSLVEALESKGEVDAAIGEYLDLLSRHPAEIELGLDLAARLIASGDRPRALEIAGKIEAASAGRTNNLALVLDFYNFNDEPELALAVARTMVKARPRSVEAHIALGEQLHQMNRLSEALGRWAMIPKLVRPQHKGWARHAEVLSEHGRTTEAVASLKKALEAAPTEPSYWRLRAVLAEEQRRPQPAMQAWEEVRRLAQGPEHALLRDEARTRIVELLVGGSIANRRMRIERAEAEARQTIEQAVASRDGTSAQRLADAVEAGKFLAELHTRRENYAAAVGVQQQLLVLRPDDPGRLAELATAQRRAGQTQSAIATLEALLVAEPSRSAEVLAQMSELAFEAGDPDRALKTATRAASKDRSHVEALVRLGELHEREGDVEQAARAYDRALETTPSDIRARLRLAELELTRGNTERSARIFREILESGGPPELLREAGKRALDLAEASSEAIDLLDLAVRRTTVQPEAAEPRDLLIDALDRVSVDAVHRWLSATPDGESRSSRAAALRRPLVVSLARGPVSARMRAAEHLGALGLPDTAVPLAKMAAQLVAPRDATATVRDGFERARVGALRAAGTLRDPAAVPVFTSVLEDPAYTLQARHAAAWALARVGSSASAEALLPHMRSGTDPLMTALGCVAIAGRASDGETRTRVAPDDALSVAVLARDARPAHVRHACALGEAILTPDSRVDRLVPMLQSSDPVLAAVVAWRIGRITEVDEAMVQALLRRFVGPPGLPRDAAGAALARLLGPPSPVQPLSAPPPPRGKDAAHALERWIVETVAPRYAAVDATALAKHHDALRAALRASSQGTRAERAAATTVLAPCVTEPVGSAADETSICLAPLVEKTFTIARR
jgi:tetratricopeptide (TPR) repeat protein